MKNFVVSQNVMLVKLLELKCRDIELERYIDEILGVRVDERHISEIVMEEFPELFPQKEPSGYGKFVKELRDSGKAYTNFLKKIKTPKTGKFMFSKPGNYEKDFLERVTKQYAKIAGVYFFAIVKFIIAKMGVE